MTDLVMECENDKHLLWSPDMGFEHWTQRTIAEWDEASWPHKAVGLVRSTEHLSEQIAYEIGYMSYVQARDRICIYLASSILKNVQ